MATCLTAQVQGARKCAGTQGYLSSAQPCFPFFICRGLAVHGSEAGGLRLSSLLCRAVISKVCRPAALGALWKPRFLGPRTTGASLQVLRSLNALSSAPVELTIGKAKLRAQLGTSTLCVQAARGGSGVSTQVVRVSA